MTHLVRLFLMMLSDSLRISSFVVLLSGRTFPVKRGPFMMNLSSFILCVSCFPSVQEYGRNHGFEYLYFCFPGHVLAWAFFL